MALTDIEMIRLEVGLSDELMSDDELRYFLDKNNGSVRKASQDAARAVLFQLSQWVRFKAAELEDYGQQYFQQYMEALKLYLSDPNYSIAISGASPYCGGISKSDIRDNLANPDVNPVKVDSITPLPTYTEKSPFTV